MDLSTLSNAQLVECLMMAFQTFVFFILISAAAIGISIGIYFCFRISKNDRLTIAECRLKMRVWHRNFVRYRKQVRECEKESKN